MCSRVPNHRRRARAAGTATAPERSASAEFRLSSGRKTAISLRRRVAAAEEIQGVHGCADQLLERVRLEIAGASDCMRGCLSRELTPESQQHHVEAQRILYGFINDEILHTADLLKNHQ